MEQEQIFEEIEEPYRPNHYEREQAQFSKAYETKLPDSLALYVYGRLQGHYHFRQRLDFHGYRQSGRCRNYEIVLSHQPSVGILAHEIAHALHRMKYRGVEKKHHTKKFLRLMHRVLDYYWAHEEEYKAAYDAQVQRSTETLKARIEREKNQAAYQRTPEFKLQKLQAQRKRWETKLKRAQTAIKRLNRRIGI